MSTLPAFAGSEYVFTVRDRKPIRGWSSAKLQLDALASIAPWRIHDLRRTVATGMQKLKVNLQVVEAVLGHTSGSRAGIVGIYQRHDYANEKRAALEAWGAHVVDLRRGPRAYRQGGAVRWETVMGAEWEDRPHDPTVADEQAEAA